MSPGEMGVSQGYRAGLSQRKRGTCDTYWSVCMTIANNSVSHPHRLLVSYLARCVDISTFRNFIGTSFGNNAILHIIVIVRLDRVSVANEHVYAQFTYTN